MTSSPTLVGDTNRPSFQPTRFPTLAPTITQRDPPNIDACQLSNDGSTIRCSFDRATDRGGLKRTHPCSELLHFNGIVNALCVWASDESLIIYPTGNGQDQTSELIQIGDVVTLLDFMLRAKCPQLLSSASECLRWPTSGNVFAVLESPVEPLSPSIKIWAPSVLSYCSDYLLDLTSSTGDGGRDWSFYMITITSVVQSNKSVIDAKAISEFYQDQYQFSPPLPLPARVLRGNETYNVNVTLCNFMHRCGSSSTTVQVVDETAQPVVLIKGSVVRHHVRSEPLILQILSYVVICNQTNRVSNMLFSWKILKHGVGYISQPISTSRDPSKFKLPGLGLDVGMYTIEVSVTDQV
jgi:hypothetical protein